MITYALVNKIKTKPYPKGRGKCSLCGASLKAICGKIVTHHWRHDSIDDCDSWSESIGPWHLSWQNSINSNAVEVPFKAHRADIVGNKNIVVELQHSSIKPDEIREREEYYINLLWVFDATFRFKVAKSGSLAFFTLGRTKHINHCKKIVFLDFGDFLVEVISFNDLFTKCHGVGYIRSYEYFFDTFLSEVRRKNYHFKVAFSPKKKQTVSPWLSSRPYKKTKFLMKWKHSNGESWKLEKGTLYFPIIKAIRKRTKENLSTEFINEFPTEANGWSSSQLDRIKILLRGEVAIIKGKLRIIPMSAKYMKPCKTINEVRKLIEDIRGHIEAGRIPILKESTFEKLIILAKEYEISKYGELLGKKESYKQYGLQGNKSL